MAEGTLERSGSNGRRRAEKPQRSGGGELPYLAWIAVGALGCAGAWYFLVRAAIDFGHAALGGRTVAWAFTLGATVGAIACLLLMFALVARLGRVFGLLDGSGRKSTGGRRSAR